MPKPHPTDLPSKKQLEKLIQQHSEHDLQGDAVDQQIKKLMEFFDSYGIQYDKFQPTHHSILGDKQAYPNYDTFTHIPPKHDLNKWKMAVKNIQYQQKAGLDYKSAIRHATHDWKKMEIFDFLNWMRFYQEGTQMKYKYASPNKTAQVWYENGQPGYFLHIKPDQQEQKSDPIADENAANEAREQESQKKQVIEKQRQKIIGRLDSAEKLLRSQEGQMFAGPELEGLMESIYQLKKKVQLVNKLSVSTRLYEDMIVREANVLTRRGFVKAADVLYSVAQTPNGSAELLDKTQDAGGSDATDLNTLPQPAAPPNPSGAGQSGVPAGLPSTAPGVPNVQTGADTGKTPIAALQGDNQPLGIKEFIENMNEGNKTEADDLEVSDQDELMVSEAQAVPTNIPPAALEDVPMTADPAPARGDVANLPPPKEDEPLEVKEEDIPAIKNQAPKLPVGGDEAVPVDSGFDAKMDAVMAGVSIADIVSELEDLAKIFKVREIPRRLSIVDMMLDAKGLASYFPNLAEAQNKSIDSNNYISTRVDDILSKLRGALESKNIDLRGDNEQSPETEAIRNKLQQDEDKELQRKQNRKEQANMEEDQAKKPAPQVDMGELAPPQPVQPVVPKPAI